MAIRQMPVEEDDEPRSRVAGGAQEGEYRWMALIRRAQRQKLYGFLARQGADPRPVSALCPDRLRAGGPRKLTSRESRLRKGAPASSRPGEAAGERAGRQDSGRRREKSGKRRWLLFFSFDESPETEMLLIDFE
jgi:hypothetical protein